MVLPAIELNGDPTLANDQYKILKGVAFIIDEVGALIYHIGSAHGRSSNPPQLVVTDASLAVNASHTLVVFIMDLLNESKYKV